ncbi:MAG: glucuronate isomerase [Treponema sp.]|nr:glucuronate isomerase [Treponema sp.]
MARAFMDNEFLLENDTAVKLYKSAKDEPIYDYHCHLSPAEIAENTTMKNLADAWLGGDHYKWRMMRAMGIEERFITGNAGDYEKFLAWTRTVENLIGNPLYHWTHLELQRYFDIHEPLTEKSAPAIWEKANTLLKTLPVKDIFKKFNIYAVGTTDDPIDTLEHHKAIAEGKAPIGKIDTKVLPTFRPDKALDLFDPDFPEYIAKLSEASGYRIKNTDDLLIALRDRLDYFIKHGCLSSDHGLNYAPFAILHPKNIEKAFKNALAGKIVTIEEADAYKTEMLFNLGRIYAEKNIAMQLHMSVIRNINTRMYKNIGANTGFDAVNDRSLSEKLGNLLAFIEGGDSVSYLPKTILYSLNPKDYYPLATIMGGFQDEGIQGKIQLGSAWWFCDNRDGMEEQMRVLANLGMLPVFIGMLTDSRSFLSYSRHEYFRRILCNLIGKWVENGEYPLDLPLLEKMVKDISFGNALKYFG